MLFTTFMAYDDEGYVLWTVRQFCEGRALYSEVYSQYGPVLYAWYRGLHALAGLVFTNESARWLTLGYWLVAAASCGYMAARLTRQWLVGIAASILSFAALADMIREPFHPGGFLAMLAAVATAVGLGTLQRHATRAFVISGAILGVAMALTKINVGALFIIALGSWVAIHSGGRKWGWVAFATVAVGVIAVPVVLMRMHLANGWVQTYAMVFAAGGLPMLINLQSQRQTLFRWAAWGWMATAGALVIVMIAVFCVATGTPAAGLWDGVVIAPMRHPGAILSAINWRSGACGLALIGLLLATADWVTKGRAAFRGPILASLRLLGGLAVLVQLTGWGYELPFHAVFQFGPALAWLMATPLETAAPDAGARGRSWLAWCAIWQILQAYPVSGSQMMWSGFLFVPLLAAGCYDAICFLGERLPRPQWASGVATGILLAIGVIGNSEAAVNALEAYTRNEPLDLPGARTLRLSPRFTGEARVISRNAAVHAGVLFTTPGMWSFNIWSQKPTPTTVNTTIWQVLLTDEQKRTIITRLREEQTAMIISRGARVYNPENFLASYQPLVSVGHYTLWAQKGRTLLPLSTVELRKSNDGRTFLIFAADPTEHPVAGLQVRKLDNGEVIAKFAVEPGRSWRVVPVDLQAKPAGAMSSPDKAFLLPGYSLVQVEIDDSLAGDNLDEIEAVLTEASGAVVESFRFNKVGKYGEGR